jgi:hypothetical protein
MVKHGNEDQWIKSAAAFLHLFHLLFERDFPNTALCYRQFNTEAGASRNIL